MQGSRYIIIVGCGRLGSILANLLSADGHQLVVIDSRPKAFEALSVEFSGFTIVGEAIEQETLKQAHIEKADYLFATTTEDNVNLMVAQIASKIFNVPHVVARIYDPARERVYRGFGMETISPTNLAAQAFLEILQKKEGQQS